MKQGISQRGGAFIGFILGVLVGLAGALVVAAYVSKVPVPFLNGRTDPRSAQQDASEAQRNKNWDPNAPLYGKTPPRSTPAAPPAGASAPASAPQPGPDPLGDLARAKAAGAVPGAAQAPVAASDPFQYFVQAGAFRTEADADAQRAKLAMLGWEARVSEREQSGRTVFRVRVGPFPKRDDAEGLKDKLDAAGVDTTLVRVAR